MILIILCFIISALSFCGMCYFDKKDLEVPVSFSIVIGFVSGVAFLVMTMLSATKNSDAKSICAERDFYANLIECVSDGATFETMERIVTRSKDVNEKILKHRKYCDSAFVGCLFSKDVANADLIEIPSLYLMNFKPE